MGVAADWLSGLANIANEVEIRTAKEVREPGANSCVKRTRSNIAEIPLAWSLS